MDSGVLIKDATNLLDRLGLGLSRVTRTHYQLGFDAIDVRALVLDDAVVAIFDRPQALHWNDRVSVNARRDRQRAESLNEGIGSVHVVERSRDNKGSLQHAGLA